MNNNTLAVLVFALFITILQSAPSYAIGMAKLVVKVVDEGGAPVEGARVSLYFQSGGVEKDRTVGSTDETGIFSASGLSSNGVTGGGVNKEGYYQSVIHHDYYVTKLGLWQPWGKELNVVMRPIVKPVPMYVRNTSFKVPLIGEAVGFDLEKADWVIPYGQGVKSDFIFKVEQRYESDTNYDAKMTLTFSNPYDGIQVYKDDGGGDYNVGSWFRLPRTAPEDGYLPTIQKYIAWGPFGRKANIEDDNNYIFRVRSEIDKNGKLVKAMYGKIRRELRYAIGSGGVIVMHYYLNPDYTRNLEFDPKRNMFTITDPGENVTAP